MAEILAAVAVDVLVAALAALLVQAYRTLFPAPPG